MVPLSPKIGHERPKGAVTMDRNTHKGKYFLTNILTAITITLQILGAYMQHNPLIKQFFRSANQWICDGYSASIRYIILRDNTARYWLTSLLIDVAPRECDPSLSFEVRGLLVRAGQMQLSNLSWKEISEVLARGTNGEVRISHETYAMRLPDLEVESDMRQLDRFHCNLHMRCFTRENYKDDLYDFASIDAELRRSDIPFDGLQDLAAWLGVNNPANLPFAESKLLISPPIDLVWEESGLQKNSLSLGFFAHPNLPVERVSVSVRALPGPALDGRRQIGNAIEWKENAGLKIGKVTCDFVDADNAMVMISFGGSTVRRQFFIDPEKARNLRYLAMRVFDVDLEKIKQNIFGEKNKRFEEAINVLLFMLGFIAARPMGTDCPDIIAITAEGQFVVIECTVSISDFSNKLGKLVSRRAVLQAEFNKHGQDRDVLAYLVTAQTRDQVASKQDELRRYNVVMVTYEDLEQIMLGLPGQNFSARLPALVKYENSKE